MESHLHRQPSPAARYPRIRAIIFDMDNTLFDFVAAKQHACREITKFLDRDDWEALFSCFINSPHGFESHENIRDYFDLCGLLEGCTTRQISQAEGEGRDNPPGICSSVTNIPPVASHPRAPDKGRMNPPAVCSITGEGCSPQPSSKAVRDNLLADKSLYCNEVFSRCCAIYEVEKVRVLEPYSGARETLAELKHRGFPLAVVTDAHNGNALIRLRRTGLAEFFDHVISYDMTGAKKPAPDAFLLALEKLGTKPSETLLVGDSIRRDIAPAKELGILTAYAKYGDRNVRARDPPGVRPDFVLGDIRELVGLVQ